MEQTTRMAIIFGQGKFGGYSHSKMEMAGRETEKAGSWNITGCILAPSEMSMPIHGNPRLVHNFFVINEEQFFIDEVEFPLLFDMQSG